MVQCGGYAGFSPGIWIEVDAPICETGLCASLVCVKTIATLSESPRACSPVCEAGVPVSSAPFMCTIFVEQQR